MSVPPQVMQQMQAARQGGAPASPAAGGPPGPAAAPMAAPMAAPQPQQGRTELGSVQVHIAMQILERALPMFGSQSKEGAAIIRTLSTLSKDFGQRDTSDLVPAEVMSMVQGMPQQGGGAPVQRQLLRQMQPGNNPQQPGPQQPVPQG